MIQLQQENGGNWHSYGERMVPRTSGLYFLFELIATVVTNAYVFTTMCKSNVTLSSHKLLHTYLIQVKYCGEHCTSKTHVRSFEYLQEYFSLSQPPPYTLLNRSIRYQTIRFLLYLDK